MSSKMDTATHSESSSDSENEGKQIRVAFQLDPSIQDDSLKVPEEPIAVPHDLGRKGLSLVIQHLLELEETKFDFTIQGKLLRNGVESAARRHGLSLEQAVPLIYFPAQRAPQNEGESEKLPDWISCLTTQDGLLLTGDYSGMIHVYQTGSDALVLKENQAVHSSPIKSLAVSQDDDQMYVAAGSLDCRLQIHKWDGQKLIPYASCLDGHENSVGALDFKGPLLASGDWDGGLYVWDYTNLEEVDEQSKRLKVDNDNTSSSMDLAILKPKSALSGHAAKVSGVCWNGPQQLVTSSWDHSVKVWNVERQDCVLTLNGSRVVSCMDASIHSPVVATGHPDCSVRLWDVRVEEKSSEITALTTDTTLKPRHEAWVSGVHWDPTNAYILASTSHDGTVKVWDIRSSVPLFSIRAHEKEEKGLAVTYDKNGTIYCGGSDCVVKRYSSSSR